MTDATTAQARTPAFPPTQWSVVLAAGAGNAPHSSAALEILCRTYWHPLYAYIRRFRHSPHDAQDLTQEFFARLLAGAYLERADREKGRFRTFLLTALKRFLVNEWDRARAQKRGGGQQALPLDGETRAFTPTAIDEPGAPALARALANSLSRITLDDANSAQNPSVLRHPNGDPFALTNRFRGGDTVQNTVGVLGFDFSLYRIFPTGPAEYTAANQRPAAPEPVGGNLRVAAMNTLNYFLTLDPLDDTTPDNPIDNICGPTGNKQDCRGADFSQPSEFTRQRDKLLAAITGLDADIVGLNELENTTGVEPLGDPTNGIVAGLNAMLGAGTYTYIDTGVIGTDAIRVGLLYKPARVFPVGGFQILDTSVDPRFRDSKNRPVLAQTFEDPVNGGRFTVAVNHFKSKGSDCNDVGDPDIGDGQGNCNQTRLAAAQALVDWLATDPTGSGDPDFLIMGDLNSYAQEDPIDAIKAGPDDAAGTIDDYTNLIAKYQGPYAYSYVFDGQAGYLDQALASSNLVPQVTGAADWHINSDEPKVLDYSNMYTSTKAKTAFPYYPNLYRSSDHDPVISGISLFADAAPTVAAPIADQSTFWGDAWSFTFASGTFSDANTAAGDKLVYTATLGDGSALPAWQGIYFYGDYCSGTIWGLPSPPSGSQPVQLFQSGFKISTFGVDEAAELYVADYSGAIYRLEKRP